MRLERLYIENFGGLHHYALDFTPGLTVIRAPNGYGKTTLAEFIRAMFYGFPRKGKNLEKSRRQKYTPWQGGRFGGSLDFAFEGGRYRIQRSFGATPKGDIFTLLDLETGGPSSRFSENIGLELFGLDADSFERSTYLPQLREQGDLTTDGIQAKLSDLVEDSGDLGNFEEAMGALRSARSTLVPYRGSGGAVAKAQAQVTRLQMETETKAALEAEEENLTRQIRQQQDARIRVRNLQTQTRERLDRSLLQAVTEAAHREYGALLTRREDLELERRALESRCPMGLPDESRIGEAELLADQLAALQPRPETEAEEIAARVWLEENRIFDSHIPEAKELDDCRRHIAAMEAGQARLEGLQVSADEKKRYDRLLQMEQEGLLEPERLETLIRTAGRLQSLELASGGDVLTAADQTRYRELMAYFASGIPREEDVRKYWRSLAEAARLRQEEPEKKVSGRHISDLVTGILPMLGLGGIGIAIWLLTAREFIWAGLIMALGLGLMAAGIWLFFGRRTDRARVLGRKSRIQTLEAEAEAFIRRFTETRPLNLGLQEISRNRDALFTLEEERRAALARQAEAAREANRIRADLSRQLGTADVNRGILELRMAKEQLAQYRRSDEGKTEGIREALRTVEEHRNAAETFLRRYFPDGETVNLHALLDELQRRTVRYAGARKTLEARAQRESEKRRLEGKLAEFFLPLSMSIPREPRRALAELRDHRKTWDALAQEAARLDWEIPECRARLEEELSRPLDGSREDPELLRGEIARLKKSEDAASEQLLRMLQQREQLADRLEALSSAEQELEFWKEKLARDRKQAELLDETMACLDSAREELRNNYVGPLRRAFAGYMEKLMDEPGEKILMTADFHVRLERSGAARELGFFSAGQTDLVMLCMRLALVDALFRQEKPVVILDDPFVNLDDTHTRQALELLEELSQDRQILYLVCNSSRDF